MVEIASSAILVVASTEKIMRSTKSRSNTSGLFDNGRSLEFSGGCLAILAVEKS